MTTWVFNPDAAVLSPSGELQAKDEAPSPEAIVLEAMVRNLQLELNTARLYQAEARDAAALMQAENERLRQTVSVLEIAYQWEKERRKEAEAALREAGGE